MFRQKLLQETKLCGVLGSRKDGEAGRGGRGRQKHKDGRGAGPVRAGLEGHDGGYGHFGGPSKRHAKGGFSRARV